MRHSQRDPHQLRDVRITRHYTCHAEGSVLIEYGQTKVLCTASVIPGVPRFLKGQNQGWVTAEYGMLPRATQDRTDREASRGKQGGRTMEIQRLIGRAIRSALDLSLLGENTITLDCDVLQADGGTRTASITGACIALVDALRVMDKRKPFKKFPLKQMVSAVSVGIVNDKPVLDLDYIEDSCAGTDMNIIMTEDGNFIEVQGTAETKPFNLGELRQMLDLGTIGCQQLFLLQKAALEELL